MRKLIVLAAIAFCLSVVCAQGTKSGGKQLVDFNKKNHGEAYEAALDYLSKNQLENSNSAPEIVAVFQQIVSGNMYTFHIKFGQNVWIVEVWSQPWLNNLQVVSAKKDSQK